VSPRNTPGQKDHRNVPGCRVELFLDVSEICGSVVGSTLSDEDVWVVDGIRRDGDRDIREMLTDGDEILTVIEGERC
jgi:hypothetical protein